MPRKIYVEVGKITKMAKLRFEAKSGFFQPNQLVGTLLSSNQSRSFCKFQLQM